VKRTAAVAAALALAAAILAGCASAPATDPSAAKARVGGAVGAVSAPRSALALAAPPKLPVLRIGYVADLPDAIALIDLQNGYLHLNLGPGMTVDAIAYPSGTAESAALAAGRLDAAYLDPVAAITAWQATRGHIKIIAGAASGGSQLIVRLNITTAAQLARKTITAPAGTSQQAALDYWLRANNQHPAAASPGMSGPAAVAAFRAGTIAGAWEPAPYDTQMTRAGGHVLISESALWPATGYTTAVLAVTTRLLATRPAAVTGLLRAHIQSEDLLSTTPASAEPAIAASLTARHIHLTTAALTAAFTLVRYTDDPLPATISTEAQHAAAAGLIKPATALASIYDLAPLNVLLRAAGQLPVHT
jgi:NitT/TauT family transport system substrate-binding protein